MLPLILLIPIVS